MYHDEYLEYYMATSLKKIIGKLNRSLKNLFSNIGNYCEHGHCLKSCNSLMKA